MIDINNTEYGECFICFNKETNEKLVTMTLLQDYYWSSCECCANVHMKCFKEWTRIRETCPLCRNPYISKSQFCKKMTRNIVDLYILFPFSVAYIFFILYLAYVIYSDIHNLQ